MCSKVFRIHRKLEDSIRMIHNVENLASTQPQQKQHFKKTSDIEQQDMLTKKCQELGQLYTDIIKQ
jgi:CII-binding regulator of phage lambda lysogenization HflD